MIKLKTKIKKNKLLSYAALGGLAVIIASLPDAALAIDLDKAAKAATAPLIKVVTDHWGKIVGLAALVAAGLGEGDLRTRGIRAAIGGGCASGVVLGILAAISE